MSAGGPGPVLITGAFGQVGQRCIGILLARGRAVIATDLQTPANAAVADALGDSVGPGTLTVAYADLLDRDAVADLIATHRPSAIIHLAGMFAPLSYRNASLARRVNVDGTTNVVDAATRLEQSPLVLFASSAAVYGSRNPYRYPEFITAETPVDPIDQYGEDKVLAEAVIAGSGLPHALLRLGGVLSPDGAANMNRDYLLLMRAMPGDNRLHAVDARDVALAFANGVDRRHSVNGRILNIVGNDSYRQTNRSLEDEILEAVGVGRLGATASLPGDPTDDRGWGFTGWFETAEAQALLDYQQHNWAETITWIAEEIRPRGHRAIRVLGPLLRVGMRTVLRVQRRMERRGRYADPWALLTDKYGPQVMAGRHRGGPG